MSKLEDLRPNASIHGILPNCLVTVVSTQWFGSEALELTYKDPAGKVANELLYRHDEPRIEVAAQGRPWSFDGDGRQFRLVSEAHRIRLAHLFDPVLAVHTSVVEPLPLPALRAILCATILDAPEDEHSRAERHFMRLVAHDEVPATVGNGQFRLYILVPAELIEPGDDEVVLHKPVTGARGLQFVIGEDLERQMEPPVELVLPLLGEAPRAHDEALMDENAGLLIRHK